MTVATILALVLVAIAVAGWRLAESVVRVREERRLPARIEEGREFACGVGSACEDLWVEAEDGTRLEGWYFTPPQASQGLAILLHGFADSRRKLLPHAALFLRQGLAVLVADSRGHGTSGGAMVTFGLREKHDVSRWLGRLAADREIGFVLLFGQSMGAAVALQVLSVEERIDAVIAEAGYFSFFDAALDKICQRLGVPEAAGRLLLRPLAWAGFLYARIRYGADLYEAHPGRAMEASTVPVLLVHGEEDRSVAPWQSAKLHGTRPAGTEHWRVPGAGHTDAIAVAPDYEERLREWVTPRRAAATQ